MIVTLAVMGVLCAVIACCIVGFGRFVAEHVDSEDEP